MDKEQTKQYNHEYYLKNKEKIKANVKNWAENNPEKIKGYVKKINNSQKARERKDKWIEKNQQKNKQVKNEWQKNYYKKNPKVVNAQNIAKQIPLKENCEICKSTKNLQRHHWNYDKPLLVNTLCSTCHKIQHIKHFETNKFGGGN